MESFGFATFKIDGHNIYEIIEAFEKVIFVIFN
jgi:transketolase N-terminal domain/subunit